MRVCAVRELVSGNGNRCHCARATVTILLLLLWVDRKRTDGGCGPVALGIILDAKLLQEELNLAGAQQNCVQAHKEGKGGSRIKNHDASSENKQA